MLSIRSDQLWAFYHARQAAAWDTVRIATALKLSAGASAELQSGAARDLEAALQRADNLGLVTVEQISIYIDICLEFGWDFEDRPDYDWTRAALRNPLISSAAGRAAWTASRLRSLARTEQNNQARRERFLLS